MPLDMVVSQAHGRQLLNLYRRQRLAPVGTSMASECTSRRQWVILSSAFDQTLAIHILPRSTAPVVLVQGQQQVVVLWHDVAVLQLNQLARQPAAALRRIHIANVLRQQNKAALQREYPKCRVRQQNIVRRRLFDWVHAVRGSNGCRSTQSCAASLVAHALLEKNPNILARRPRSLLLPSIWFSNYEAIELERQYSLSAQ
jgi:hypothetical protein